MALFVEITDQECWWVIIRREVDASHYMTFRLSGLEPKYHDDTEATSVNGIRE